MIKVSIVIPFYKNRKWLLEALESIYKQSYKNYEIILINDGSDENIFELIKNKKIIYIYQQNKGPAAARNIGITNSNGEYIAFLDSDDLFLPNKLDYQVALMDRHKNIIMSHTSYERIDQNYKKIAVINSGKFSGHVYPKIIYNCPIATPTVMIRKNLLGKLKFDENIKIGEDIIFWSKIAKTSQIIGIEKVFTQVRIHDNNTMNDPIKYLEGGFNIINVLGKYDETLKKSFIKYCHSSIYLRVGQLYFENNNKKLCFKFCLLSFLKWPFNLNIYKKLFLLIMHPKLINWIKIKRQQSEL